MFWRLRCHCSTDSVEVGSFRIPHEGPEAWSTSWAGSQFAHNYSGSELTRNCTHRTKEGPSDWCVGSHRSSSHSDVIRSGSDVTSGTEYKVQKPSCKSLIPPGERLLQNGQAAISMGKFLFTSRLIDLVDRTWKHGYLNHLTSRNAHICI